MRLLAPGMTLACQLVTVPSMTSPSTCMGMGSEAVILTFLPRKNSSLGLAPRSPLRSMMPLMSGRMSWAVTVASRTMTSSRPSSMVQPGTTSMSI